MTVFKKIVAIRITDPKKPHKDFEIYQRQIGGVDAVLLSIAPGIHEATYKFICSDNNPSAPRTAEDIDRLLSNSNIKILREMSSHPNDPVTSGNANHSIQIETNIDNPNLPDKFISKAKNIHEEAISKDQLRIQNKQIEYYNKQLKKKESSTDDSDKLKYFDEGKSTAKVGEVERE